MQRLKEAPLAEQEQLWERFLAVVEPELLNVALQACGGNRAMAARLLGMHRETSVTNFGSTRRDLPTKLESL